MNGLSLVELKPEVASLGREVQETMLLAVIRHTSKMPLLQALGLQEAQGENLDHP